MGEVTAVEEVEAKGINGAGAERAGGVAKVYGDRGEEKVALKEEGEGRVIKAVGFR